MFKKYFLKNKVLKTSFNTRVNFKLFNFPCFLKTYKFLFKNFSYSKDDILSTRENISFFITNKSLKGFRHKNRLPVRGQRTRTNAKTVKRR
jgi:ribosomal protein S13